MQGKEDSKNNKAMESQASALTAISAIDDAIRSEGPFGLANEMEARIPLTSATEFPASNNAVLMKTRLLLDQQYVASWHKGRRMRKKPQHM